MQDREVIQKTLDYNAETGELVWKIARGNRNAGSKAGVINGKGYLIIKFYGKRYQAHRLIWIIAYGVEPKDHIDHINGNKTDNRLCNLREVTNRQNQYNQRKPRIDNQSGYLGVSRYGNRWMACIKINGKTSHIGYYDTAEQASEAYKTAKRIHHETCTI